MSGLVRIVLAAIAVALVATAGGQAASAPGSPPSLSWSPTTGSGAFDFGPRVSAVSQTFTLANNGGSATAALKLTVSPVPGPFTIVADGCTGKSLGPKKSCQVTIRYTPGTASDSGTLSASSPRPSAVSTSLALTGAKLVGKPLTASALASPSFTRTYAWTIRKSVDKSAITQAGGSVTFHYTVTASHDGGTDSGWLVRATATVWNPNAAGDDVSGVNVSATVDNGGSCPAGSPSLNVPGQGSTTLNFSCAYGGPPSPGAGTLTLTVSWPAQTLHSGAPLAAGSTTATAPLDFGDPAAVSPVDDCVSVSDTIGGSLGTRCVGDPNPATFTYPNTVTVSTDFTCQTLPNTATFTTDSTGTTGSASQSVQACGNGLTLSPGTLSPEPFAGVNFYFYQFGSFGPGATHSVTFTVTNTSTVPTLTLSGVVGGGVNSPYVIPRDQDHCRGIALAANGSPGNTCTFVVTLQVPATCPANNDLNSEYDLSSAPPQDAEIIFDPVGVCIPPP
jgi:hypothetical protein